MHFKCVDVELRQMLRGGKAHLNMSHCVVLEIKREQDLESGFVQLFAEMLVVTDQYVFHPISISILILYTEQRRA